MELLKCLLYGLVSGIAEFMPISSRGHQVLLSNLYGSDIADPVMDLCIDIALLAAAVFCCWSMIIRFYINNQSRAIVRRKRNFTNRTYYDMQLIKNASIPLVVALAICRIVYQPPENLVWLTIFFLMNGCILYLPARFIRANKDSRTMTGLDSVLIGVFGALSVFPGISRIACTTSIASIRGADIKESYNWSLMISIPVLITFVIFDIIALIGQSSASFSIWYYLLSSIGAFVGGVLSISMMRSLVFKSDISGFSYYAWGAAILSLTLYMIV